MALQLASFSGTPTAVVQGASRGLGLAFVHALLQATPNFRVVATCRQPAAAQELGALKAAYADRLAVAPVDITAEASVAAAAHWVSQHTDTVQLVINTAGVLHEGEHLRPEKRLAEVTLEALMRSFQVNACGPLLVAKHFQGLLPRDGRAVFASLSARLGSIGDNHSGGWYAYRGAKAAQNMFTKTLAVELGRTCKGLVCVALHPGTVATQLSEPFRKNIRHPVLEPDEAARRLLTVLDGLTPAHSGGFFAFDGTRIEW